MPNSVGLIRVQKLQQPLLTIRAYHWVKSHMWGELWAGWSFSLLRVFCKWVHITSKFILRALKKKRGRFFMSPEGNTEKQIKEIKNKKLSIQVPCLCREFSTAGTFDELATGKVNSFYQFSDFVF